MEYLFYVLKNEDKNIFYKGITNNLTRRLRQHELGQHLATRAVAPLKLVYVQICKDRRAAISTEKYFKSGYGREIISELDK